MANTQTHLTAEDLDELLARLPRSFEGGVLSDDCEPAHGGTRATLLSDILWDADGEDIEGLGLPGKVLVLGGPTPEDACEQEDEEDDLSDLLSDEFGYCHEGFSIAPLDEGEILGSGTPVLVHPNE